MSNQKGAKIESDNRKPSQGCIELEMEKEGDCLYMQKVLHNLRVCLVACILACSGACLVTRRSLSAPTSLRRMHVNEENAFLAKRDRHA